MSRKGRTAPPGFQRFTLKIAGAAVRPFRDTRPLLQEGRVMLIVVHLAMTALNSSEASHPSSQLRTRG